MASYVSNASKQASKTQNVTTTPKATTISTPKTTTTVGSAKPVTTSTYSQPKTQQSTTSTPYSNISDVHNLGKQYGMDNQMLGWIAEKAGQGIAMDTTTPQKQAVYDAYQSYLKNEIVNKASQGATLSDPNAWKNNIYNSTVSQNLNQSYDNLNNTITNRFDTVDTSLSNIDTGLNNYYGQFNNFEQQMYADHNGQFDILKYLQEISGGSSPFTPSTPSTPPPATSSPGHVYVPGETSNNEGYVQKQLVTNDLFNRYLQQIYQGGF